MTLYKALANALYGNYLIYKRVFKFIKNHSNDILQEQGQTDTLKYLENIQLYLSRKLCYRTYGC
jgi:hypothetical protein